MTKFNQKTNIFFKRMLFLLAMVLTGSSASWGQTTITTFSMPAGDPEGADDKYYLGENGGVTYYAQGLKDNDGKFVSKTENGQTFRKLQASEIESAHIKLQFAKGTIKAGYVLSVTCVNVYTDNTNAVGYKIGGSNASVTGSYTNGTPITLTHIITENEIVDNQDNANEYIRIYRNSYVDAYGTISVARPAGFSVTFKPNNTDWGTVTATVNGNPITSGTFVSNGTKVTFTATPKSSEYLIWGWDGDAANNWGTTTELTVNKDVTVTHNFTPGIKINAINTDGTLGSVNVSNGGKSGTNIHVTPWPGTVTFTATPKEGVTFKGWYEDVDCNTLATSETTLTYTNDDDILKNTGTINRWAKFEATTKPFTVTADWNPTIPANASGWGLATATVKADGANVDASEYTLSYAVVSGPLSLDGTSKNATVTSEYNKENNHTAKVRVTATPVNGAKYTAASAEFTVDILPVAKPNVTVSPKQVRVGESVTLGLTRDRGFNDVKYIWTLSDNAKTSLFGYSDPISESQAANADDPKHTFVAKAPTSSPISVNLKFSSSNGYYNNSDQYRSFEEAYNNFTVKPVAVPTVSQESDGVHFTYEEDYGNVDAYLQYYVGVVDDAHRYWEGMDEDGHGQAVVSNLPHGTRIYVQSVVRFKYPSDAADYTYVNSDMISFVTGESSHLPAISLMMQPRYKNGIAKRYIPIGVISELNAGTLTPLESQWPEGVTNGEGAITNYTMGYLLGDDNDYRIDREDKGVCISSNGKAQWAWSGDRDGEGQYLPKTAAFYMDVAGTMDIVLFAENTYNGSQSSGNMSDRRYIKVWYLNDQCTDGRPVEIKSWGILGKRYEGNSANGGNGNELRLHIRLPQLGTDGKTTLFFTYEGNDSGSDVSDAEHDLWIRGFMIQRPDLTQSIGRTDNKYTDGNSLTNICVATENTPYIWSFEPKTTGHSNTQNHIEGHDAVGFRPVSNTGAKKTNEFDGRTYICGDKCDHVLVYCDNEDEPGKVAADARPEFDGRLIEGQDREGKSHIEFVRPTVMAGNNGNDDKFNPIKSNGLKVNVTGSGWFKVKAAAPNCDVKMKVLTSTNGGNSKIRVLKEFLIPQTSEMDWNEYTAYLKAQVTFDETFDADDAEGDPEKNYMSLYVVFEAADGVALDSDGKVNGTSEYPQLNINQMSWLNEVPMDYVFQREENPKLLTEIQTIKRGDEVVLRWQASNKSIKETNAEGVKVNTFDINDQAITISGEKSMYGSASRVGQNDGNYVWDIAANPAVGSHTEAAQRYTDKYHYTDGTNNTDDTRFIPGNESSEMEFGLPITGSFYRLYPEKNGHVIAYIIPTAANEKIYVLDETGARVDYLSNVGIENYATLTQSQKARGGVKSVSGAAQSDNAFTSATVEDGTGAIRLDIYVSAGKEYFICGDNAISLAALHWYQTREGDAVAATLNNDGDNSTVINDAKSAQSEGDYTGTMYRNVTLNRSFTAGQWASLVLPFSMNELKFKEIFGDNAICIHFTDVDLSTNTVNLTHHYYNMIVAGRPVFVRPSQNVSAAAIKDVTLQAGNVIPTTAGGITFTGNIGKTTMPANSLFMSGNAIKHTTVAKEVNAMRVWIYGGEVLKDINKATSAPVARLLNYDGTLLDGDIATGIESALAEVGMDAAVISASTVIYNLQGNKVATGAEMQNLPAGVYVVKGKKFIVK